MWRKVLQLNQAIKVLAYVGCRGAELVAWLAGASAV